MFTLLLALSSSAAFSQTAFEQALAQHNQVKTREQWLTIDSTHYRQIEANGKYYYLKMGRDETKPSAELRCDLTSYPVPKNIEATMEESARAKDFIEKLEKTCGKSTGKVEIALDSSFIPLIEDFDRGGVKNKSVRMGITPGLTNPGMQVKKKF